MLKSKKLLWKTTKTRAFALLRQCHHHKLNVWSLWACCNNYTHPEFCVPKVMPPIRTTNWPTAEPPLSETKILRAIKATDHPAPTSARQHTISTSAVPAPSSKAAYFGKGNSHPASPSFSVGRTGLTEGSDGRTTEALIIWEKQVRSRQATWLGLDPQQHFTSALSPTL